MLTIPLDTVGWIIVKAREFDVKVEGDAEGDDGNPTGALQHQADDSTEGELRSWIDDLTDTQQAELVALFWLGRGDGDAAEFGDLIAQARRSRVTRTSKYLLGQPLLADYLEEGLEALGVDTSDLESGLR